MRAPVNAKKVVLASADQARRIRLRDILCSMRWEVCEARGGAEAFQMLEEHSPEALILDRWLPDLEIGALTTQVQQFFPHVDLLPMDGSAEQGGFRSTRRNELLQAVRESIPRVSEGP